MIFLSTKQYIEYTAPAYVLAPLVSMVARESICLGWRKVENSSGPVRIFAPDQISLSSRYIFIGAVAFLRGDLGEFRTNLRKRKKIT